MTSIFRFLILTSALLVLLLVNCGGSIGTGVSNPPTPTATTKAAALVASVFGNQENAQIVADFLIRMQTENQDPEDDGQFSECAEDDPGCTCEIVAADTDPDNITSTFYTDPGTYGAIGSSMTVSEEDFCQLPNGTDNPGLGPDDNGRFAAFEIDADVPGQCSDGSETTTFAMQAGSSGIYRNRVDENGDPLYQPEIYGTFNFSQDGDSITVDCTIFLDINEVVVSASCTDEDGETIDQETDATCQINSE
ncbi:MAG: hypothetical protein H7A33_07450 [Deltaproteobacteria bacterium]|nr:hypothetical protein [Deltaproteobacteria bacterium]